MPDLERQLRELGELVEFPATPNLAPAVRTRISDEPRERRGAWWPARVAIAFAVIVLAMGAAFAVPQARTQILEWFGVGGVTVTRMSTSPGSSIGDELRLGPEVTLADARMRAAFDALEPGSTLGPPDAVHLTFIVRGGQISFLYDAGDSQLLITQFQAPFDVGLVEKTAGPGTRIEFVSVKGGDGVWLEGEPHSFGYVDDEGRSTGDASPCKQHTDLGTGWHHGSNRGSEFEGRGPRAGRISSLNRDKQRNFAPVSRVSAIGIHEENPCETYSLGSGCPCSSSPRWLKVVAGRQSS